VPRLVDALPNGPRSFTTVQVFLAGGVPEVMLHLRRAGLLDTGVLTVSGRTLGAALDWWEASERRTELRRFAKRATASIRTMSSWIPRAPPRRADFHSHLPAR
jgi:dihydroxyacid dehydratase/phosphogluconate dehydratase